MDAIHLSLSIFGWICFTFVLPTTSLPSSSIANATYDYLIAGCGTSGLTVATRLTEQNFTVLCIEAGQLDHYEASVLVPYDIGVNIGGVYDWNLTTVPQLQLDGGTRPLPAGRVVGGGSVINGMIWNRGNQDDYNAWESLGNAGWAWDDMLPYFIKSENYTPYYYMGIPQDYQDHFNASVHGSSGPVHVSYPHYYWSQAENFLEALENLSVPLSQEPQSGLTAGGYFLPASLNPDNQTRCDARRAYYDPAALRPNLHLITAQHVTRILFTNDSVSEAHAVPPPASDPTTNLVASGLEYAPDAFSPRQTVYARREVIIAAGALHSPQILQLSGIGPSSLLTNHTVPVLVDLPGIGSNLQDHCLVNTNYPYQNTSYLTLTSIATNNTLYNQYYAEYFATKTGPFTAKASTALGFPSLSQILGTNTTTNFLSGILTNPNSTLPYLPSIYTNSPSLQAGYLSQLSQLIPLLANPTTPAYELLQNNAGALTPSLLHPLSRGTVSLSSSSPFDPPLIDPNWLSHPLDLSILISALQFNEHILSTPSLTLLNPDTHTPSALLPPPSSSNLSALEAFIRAGVNTEFHYSGTTAMMPRELGGVVGPDLRVYGTRNLRVVDTGVFPIVPGGHTASTAYAVGERGADLIKMDAAAGLD